MAKVFRFHEGNNLYDWQDSNPLNDKAIAAIEDPNGEHASREITSIPSPFARIDLMRTAFKEVANTNLIGRTIHHKMVSDALDIGQIFFNYEKFKDKIEIISWDPKHDLDNLVNSNNPNHRLLGESLRLYFIEDAGTYNFKDLNKLYLINYKDGPNAINIIGGTSPASLFFTSANKFDLHDFQDGSDTFLDDVYCPLHKRDPEYIKYLFSLGKSIPNFVSKFSQVNDYFDETQKQLDTEFRAVLNQLTSTSNNDLPSLSINGGGEIIEIFNIPLKKSRDKSDKIKDSKFVLAAEKGIDGNLPPLVLPNDIFSGQLRYVTDNWIQSNRAPHFDNNPVDQRVLPFDGNKYPYLTISDFLEPVIIRTEYPIDDYYFNKGNYEGGKSFLLPIKPLFFEYFPVDFLRKVINGEKAFELKPLQNGSVEAILRIPIQQNNHITFRRTYYSPVNQAHKPDTKVAENKGAVIENRINLAITPFYKFPIGVEPEYNIAFYDADFIPLLEDNAYEFKYFDNKNHEIPNVQKVQRRFKEEENINMFGYVVNHNFDYIQIKHSFGSGLILPEFEKRVNKGTSQFSFAIDFGTTNSHIEYSVDGNIPQPFEITNHENRHCGRLIDDTKFDEPYLKLNKDDILPNEIGLGSTYQMPQRTAVSYHKKTNFSQPVFSMGNINIPFKYERLSFALNTEIKTNLKWNNDANSSTLMQQFFEQLIKMIRNKVLLNNGDLEKTKIVWSYPASMLEYQLIRLEEKWTNTIHKYLGKDINIQKVCESLTPFYYYTNVEGKAALEKPMVSLDIGGGTSDVAVYKVDNPILFSSYKFAGDAIFGDNYNRNININGFVQKYHHKLSLILQENKQGNLKGIMESIKERNNSNDAINALFSLENNKQLKDKKINISFLSHLKEDNEFKIIFLLFYVAQVYHVAQLLKSKDIEIPSSFTFSGTASKLLTIIDASPTHTMLQKLVNLVFKHIFELESTPSIEINLPNNPKELASKGALYFEKAKKVDLKEIREVLLSKEILISTSPEYNYSNVSNLEKEALSTYDEFLSFFFNLNKQLSFRDYFGIEKDIIDFSQTFLESKKVNSLKMGIKSKLAEIEHHEDEPISETLFFYPLVGCLGELAYELTTKRQ
ncbi:hypothetical protein [Sediminicola arcticus]|uniref:Virulence factor SrfB n=1 Tax=Sediminicola arcticus TaxID=1574308 RepID=A0ABV2SPR5_9FLAO